MIESIYDQFKPALVPPNPTLTIDGYDEDELKQAVEKSKHDYFQLKQKEDQQELKEAEEDEFDLGPSILFTDSSTLHKDPDQWWNCPRILTLSQNLVNLLVLVRLFLFNPDDHSTGKVEIKKDHKVFEPEDSDEELLVVDKQQHVDELPETTKPAGQQTLPDWFQDDIRRTLNPHNEKFIPTKSYEKKIKMIYEKNKKILD